MEADRKTLLAVVKYRSDVVIPDRVGHVECPEVEDIINDVCCCMGSAARVEGGR